VLADVRRRRDLPYPAGGNRRGGRLTTFGRDCRPIVALTCARSNFCAIWTFTDQPLIAPAVFQNLVRYYRGGAKFAPRWRAT